MTMIQNPLVPVTMELPFHRHFVPHLRVDVVTKDIVLSIVPIEETTLMFLFKPSTAPYLTHNISPSRIYVTHS